MATCKDCIHCEACERMISDTSKMFKVLLSEILKMNCDIKYDSTNILSGAEICQCFQDRARFVELPCHTGEKVWVTYLGRKGAIRSEEKGEVIGFFITSSLRVCASVILEDGSTFTGIYGKNVFPRKEELGKEKKCLIEK